ncbi:MAG: tRNA (adenosine(37)-N6)-threonylcarbamoyltransferase complex dimerization subunit type 1 TsaB [Candidatus Sumerlaeaceae bacterium]|nr:tRNA (adenosine(37)-N6)-threonylcarbamoyltransferase complex dimerization subunit type 1 TsaB [Candidatus Sumerlaeaceae bacterium]
MTVDTSRAIANQNRSRLILALETSGTTGGAALLSGNQLLGSISFSSPTLYSQRLLPSVEWLLARVGVSVSDITAVAVAKGPGSFTGLRIGMSAAKAIAYANSAVLLGIHSMEALALRAGRTAPGQPVCTVFDARQGEVYAAMFSVPPLPLGPGSAVRFAPERLRPDHAGPLSSIASWITEPTLFAGEAILKYESELRALLGERFAPAPPELRLPSAEEVAALGALRLSCGEADDLASLKPDYVRPGYVRGA